MQTLKQVAKAHRYAAMQPAAITERQALDAAIDLVTPAYTQGPWEHLGRGDIITRHAPTCSNDGLTDVASVYLTSDETCRANATLIAQAPAILIALQALHAVCLGMDAENQMERPTEAEYQAAMTVAAVAIAQATGAA